jgi:hypothetical protein
MVQVLLLKTKVIEIKKNNEIVQCGKSGVDGVKSSSELELF